MNPPTQNTDAAKLNSARVTALFKEQQQNIICHTDRLFSRLMIFQWIFSIGLALWLSPLTWHGSHARIHPHIWLALILGGVITSVPVLLAQKQPGKNLTRHLIALGQMLMSALLIDLTGGRIETHFHVFGSLAILAFYRDWRVLITASAVVFLDHLLRGFFIPQTVYGVLSAPIWRSLEHAGWVVFEVVFLIISIRKSLNEMLTVAERQVSLETLNESIERTVADRTMELTREVMDRRQTEDKLRASEARLAQAQQIARLGSWEWDIVKNKTSWSEETRRMYGHPPGDLGFTMEKCLECIHPDDVNRVNHVMAEALRTHQPFVCEHRIRLSDGTERVIQGRGEILVNNEGQPVKMFGVVQDITEAKRAEEALRRSEEQLRQAQKMEAVGRLAGGVAHDFNNLLTVINGYSALSLQAGANSNMLRKNAREILNASERASALTHQLLAFSRKQVLQPRVLDLNEVISGMEKMLRRLIGEDIEFTTTFDTALGRIKADPGQIEQVILNMAVNARDALPRGGKLTIGTANISIDQKSSFRNRALDVGDYVMLSISDNGVGMTEEVKSHLFEPFFTTKGVGKGTGLGLATCYGIVSQSGGDIRVYSEPNSGTTFKIYLPRTDAAPDHAQKDDSHKLSGGSESVLIVEDEASVRKYIASVLCECGYRVEQAASGTEALPFLESGVFDLVITDVIMPQMSGKELYEKIKARSLPTRVLFISGYTDDALASFGVLDDELSFLEKPFSPARLTRKIREVLDGSEFSRNGHAAPAMAH